MPQLDDLVNAYHALSPSEQQAFIKKVSQRKNPGKRSVSRELVNRTTKEVLLELTTIDGNFYDCWLMKLSPEELKVLPLDAWKRTTEGKAVFKRKGKKGLEAWVIRQKAKLIRYKGLWIEELLDLVEERIGLTPTRKKKKEKGKAMVPKGGRFRQYVQEGKDEFLMAGCFTWDEIPPHLRDRRQPGIRGDLAAFYDRQHDYINNKGMDVSFEDLCSSTPITDEDFKR